MKGVILAGGTGSRLSPLTNVTNKHLLPIYNEPMIYYPIKTLASAGIKDILIVVGGENIGDFLRLLGSGKELNVTITYRTQEGSGGIPAALALAKEFIGDSKFMVVLGDNIMDENLEAEAKEFLESNNGAKIFIKEVEDPERYGVIDIKEDKVVSIEEKPKNPKSNLVASGVYMFDSKVFDLIPKLKPSARGELEVADILIPYMETNSLSFSIIKGFWTDAGTLEALYHANSIVRNKRLNK